MIHGHAFSFPDEPILEKEYKTFLSNADTYSSDRTIVVKESADLPYEELFPNLTQWYPLSGQEGRYRSALPFKTMIKEFSWALEIQDILTLIWNREAKEIIYIKARNYTPERLRFWIFHTFFPLVLELERMYRLLHVGAVEVAGKPILFSAPSFGGKSTLTDYFIQKGHTLLSDDSLGVEKRDNKYYAVPSYPYHRPYRKPEVLGYPVKNFATEIKPIHAVYLLEKSEPTADVTIEEVKGIEKFKAFHYSNFINFSFMKEERFKYFSEMAKYVPVYSITVPWDMERLDEVYAAIVEQCSI